MKTIVILAGGSSHRMGKDKIFLDYEKTSFLEHLIDKASGIFDRILISAGSEEHAALIVSRLDIFESPAHPEIILDREPGLGPIGGLLSVFEQTGLERFAVIAGDIPNADMQILDFLLERLEQEAPDRQCSAVMLQLDPEYPEPCAAAYDRSARPLLEAACGKGMRSLVKALGPDRIKTVTEEEIKRSGPAFAEPDLKYAFRNINTPEDYYSLSIR